MPETPSALTQAIMQALQSRGLRTDATQKGTGFFGPLPAAGGKTSTELSTSVNFDGKEHLIPLLVPTLDRDEVQNLLNGGRAPRSTVQKAVQFARQRIASGSSPFASNQEVPYGIALPNEPGKSDQWQMNAALASQAASEAGLPFAQRQGDESPYRLRMMDAISRVGAAGFPAEHFIGSANEPTGDRAGAMDIESLINSLQAQEQAAIKAGDKVALSKISREKAYWAKELGDSMTAQEWLDQTGSPDPMRFKNNIPFRTSPGLR